ncbi:hypothetical protein [Romboutsia lituseburensis]|uniref:NUMOD1 domain-containing protein n=1 Tax=Romboutsia lituseburensis DSM 797 TaxID=1121325 RepID=A0A1G9JBG2_9FIRM|nr:hypothetical protein [Romboutsia lituseburensis]CEH33555.1 Intron encoded nuclease repeat motif [Romboutsia lituseburensis]SDL34758.1 hypothetical protein SAMN04515677_101585 [Romboutsia lituseburensis DSM 797]
MIKNFFNRVKSFVEQNKDTKELAKESKNDEVILNQKEGTEENNNSTKSDLIKDSDDKNIIQNQQSENTQDKLQKNHNHNDINNLDIILKAEDYANEESNKEYEYEEINNNVSEELLVNNTKEQKNDNKITVSQDVSQSEIVTEDIVKCKQEINESADCNVNDEIAITIEKEEIDIDSTQKNQEVVEEFTKEDLDYIKDIKIKRGKSIKVIDVYTKEEQIFNTYKECSKKLKIPAEYIQENLKYGFTDYFGDAIKYLGQALSLEELDYINYLDSNKTPSQMLKYLNNKIFTAKISEDQRDDILCSEKLEPVKMHYTFECIDEEYDDYFRKYKSIIKRGGKKKIELVDKKGEVIEIFKSLDECADYIKKDKSQVVEMLKNKDTKVGRYEIRYSLRNI